MECQEDIISKHKSNMNVLPLDQFPLHSFDKLRYADTDRQGHVNNATFATFLETGRVEFLYNDEAPILMPTTSFVIASLNLNFIREIKWAGEVQIGSGVLRIGTSSVKVYQQIFQNGQCAAVAETIVVQVDNESAKSVPLTDIAKERLKAWVIQKPA